MNKKPTIKIVKRDERRRNAETPERLEPSDTPADSTRQMVKTVTTWVREFKQKGDTEAERVLTVLFEKSLRPNEA
jgi:hypothetical protein